MLDEPPPEFVDFVTRWLPEARAEAARWGGGDALYPAALADVALYWRWQPLLRMDPGTVLRRRLTIRGQRWRTEQAYPTDAVVLSERTAADWVPRDWVPLERGPVPPEEATAETALAAGSASVALRKAMWLPPTARAWEQPVAEAGIAWVEAYRRYRWGRWVRGALGVAVVLVATVRLMPFLAV